ncbi:MAG: alpha/beta hydrolase [Acidimicrobiia bacterium]|nr:alpha/beta hydrolase [Acidimicrobiia bacterium]
MTTTIEPETVSIPTPHGIDIAASVWPGDGDPVILSHGGGQTRHSWGATAAALAEAGHQVLSYDHRGHGDSTWSHDGDYSPLRFAEDAVSVVEWAGRPVIWTGASLGGITGLITADTITERFKALVLVDITPNPSLEGVQRILNFMGKDLERGFASLEEAADAVATYQPHRKRPQDLSGLAKNLRQGDDGRWRWHWDPNFLQMRASAQDNNRHFNPAREAAGRLKLPTLLIRGRLSDLVTEAEVKEFLDLMPHAEYVDVIDAAHMVAGDKNDIFTEAVTGFVARLDRDEAGRIG